MIVRKQRFHIASLKLDNAFTLMDVNIGYETYGELNAIGTNAIFVTHFFSATSHAAGKYHESDAEAGYWDAIIGPGKAIDTNKYFVVSSDVLCNINTKNPNVITTGPASINPETGKAYGKDFPIVTIGDSVTTQKLLCDSLGIRHLHAVCGPSLGSMQAMEWTARYPEFVDRALCVVPTSLHADPYLVTLISSWAAPILLDPKFKGGDYLESEPPTEGMIQGVKLITVTALHPGVVERTYGRRYADDAKSPSQSLANRYLVDTALEALAIERAKIADANSLLRMVRAVQQFSIVDRKKNLRAKYLFMPAVSDLMMLPAYAKNAVAQLRELGLKADYHELQGDGGHLDGVHQMAQATDVVRQFLEN